MRFAAYPAYPALGFGGSFGDPTQDPGFLAAFQPVQAQLLAEGKTQSDVSEAQSLYLNTVQQLYSQSGVDASQAFAGAAQYVTYGKTVAGAVSQVQGLISAVQNDTPGQAAAQVSSAFVGTMVGVMVAAGAVSAGLGAAIIGVSTALVGLLTQGSFFGSQTPGVEVCSGTFCNPKPDWTIGCMCVWGSTVVPGSSAWRSFPVSTSAADAGWFAPSPGPGNWGGAQYTAVTGNGVRPIDVAFPPYHQLECDVQFNVDSGAFGLVADDAFALRGFLGAFFSAWKANREFALNGLKVSDDWQVLVQFVRQWNTAHAPGAGYTFQPSTASADIAGQACGNGIFYAQTLVTQVVQNNGSANVSDILQNGGVFIHTGSILTPVGPLASGKVAATSANSGISSTAKIAAGTLAVGAGGLALYGWIAHQSVGYFFGKAFDWTVDKGKSVYSGARGLVARETKSKRRRRRR